MIKIIILTYLTIMNLCGWFLMHKDKRNAIKNRWRIPEKKLFMVSILGGSVGVLLGMNMFRHKTKHLKFKIGIPLILICHAFLLFYLNGWVDVYWGIQK